MIWNSVNLLFPIRISSFVFQRKFFFQWHEQCIMVLSKYDARDTPDVTLVYQDGREEPLSKLRVVSKEVAMTCASWTYDPLCGAYFVTNE